MSNQVDPQTGEVTEAPPTLAPSMPPAIAKAIVDVKKKVKTLGYDDNNSFQRYQYVSIDKFLDVIGRLEADAGLFTILDEIATEIREHEIKSDQGNKKSAWLHAVYHFTIFHESGVSYGPVTRKVIVPAVGAQAFGSAQSYLLKQFQRALYSVPTGDKDADAEPADNLPGGRPANAPPPPKRPEDQPPPPATQPDGEPAQPRPTAPAGMSDEDRAKHNATYNEIRRAIAECRTTYDCNALEKKRGPDIDELEKVGFSTAAKKLRESLLMRRKQVTPDNPGNIPEEERMPE